MCVISEKKEDTTMSKLGFIRRFEPLTPSRLIEKAVETAEWIEQYAHEEGDAKYWDVLPGGEQEGSFLLRETGIYGGAPGLALFYLRLYQVTNEEKYLQNAKAGVNYAISKYKGKEDYVAHTDFLPGASIGFLNGPAGGAYVASRLYEITEEEKYKEYALRVTDDLIASAKEEDGKIFWYGDYGIIGEGSLILYLVDAYETYGEQRFIEAANKGAKYIVSKREEAPVGGYRWYAMDTEKFPTIGKAGGYFPGFEYGAAGSGYILATVYVHTKDEELLETAKGAATYIQNVAVYSEDHEAALVPYNDTYLQGLYYLGVCQGPVGTSRLFYKLYDITVDETYKKFILALTNGILATGAPAKHSEGYWRTNCYCCGAAGMLEHFINIHKLTGNGDYLKAAKDAAETLIGESTHDFIKNHTNWYTQWNRHEPWKSEAYTGLYHGSAGCASSLIALAQYLLGGTYGPSYLEDPYRNLYARI